MTLPLPPVFSGCDFSGRNAVCKPAKTFGAKVAPILPPRPDWDGVAADFLHDFFPGHVWIIEKFFTESHRHFEIYGVGVYTIFRLSNNNFLHNVAGKVEGRQRRPDFLLHKVIPLVCETIARKAKKTRPLICEGVAFRIRHLIYKLKMVFFWPLVCAIALRICLGDNYDFILII